MKTQPLQFIENIVHLVSNGIYAPLDTVKHPRYVPLPFKDKNKQIWKYKSK